MTDMREYHRAVCEYCKEAAYWVVYDDWDSDFMLVCDAHKYTAFS